MAPTCPNLEAPAARAAREERPEVLGEDFFGAGMAGFYRDFFKDKS